MACFAPFLVPPGYLLAQALDLNGFRSRSLSERLLWAVSLSTPVAILLTVFAGRHLSMAATSAVAWAGVVAWLAVLGWQGATGRLRRSTHADRWTLWAAAAMVAGALYTALATLGITVGRKLYEGTYAGDWSVRIPLTAAAIHNALPIPTPFYAAFGATAPLRYYYYWYVLCGAVGRLGHLGARPVLAASSAWSGLALVATLFLFARYLFPMQAALGSDALRQRFPLRRLCVLMLPVSCILGLDLVPSLWSITMSPTRLFPEMEWWRSAGDFSLSFHTAVLYAPHHTAGLACCMLGFLLLCLAGRSRSSAALPWRQVAIFGAAAGVCFAAAVGTSTYLTVLFALTCTGLAAERAQARDWRALAVLALAGAVALPLASTYMREILAGAGTSLHSNDTHVSHARFIAFFPRNVGLPRIQLAQLGGKLHYFRPTPQWVKWLLRPPMTAILYAIEFGFFGFVFAWRGWTDLRRPGLLTQVQRMQWVLCLALAVGAAFLTSQPVIGVNDLGRHAGLALRFVAVLWATPLLVRAWNDRTWPVLRHRGLRLTVYATVLLGLGAQVWQVGVQRSYFWLVDRGVVVHPFAPFPRFPHYGTRYFETREAFEAMERVIPPQGRVQFNPASTYWTLMTDYLERPVVAFDQDCEAAFGGDIEKCHEAMPSIRGLFGGGRPIDGTVQEFDATLLTPAAFDAVCAKQQFKAVIATASDRVWTDRQSWLWVRPALFTNASMRVVLCPVPGNAQKVTR